ncbi:MAG: hypothetical protein R3D71_06640 [Rickettsiales bacterium]
MKDEDNKASPPQSQPDSQNLSPASARSVDSLAQFQVEKPELKADRTWYNSVFTQLLAPLVATRYIWLAAEEINPFNFLGKTPPKVKQGAQPWKEKSFFRYASRNFAAFGMGTTFLTIVGLYSKNTLHDIKNIYAEAVGYELGKKTEDVTLSDVFLRSKNEAVQITKKAYITRTLMRFTTASAFFVPWHKFRDKAFRTLKPKYDVNANAGVGAIGVHLYGEGFLRRPSFFDREQKLVSDKINHNDINPYSEIQPAEIQTLLYLHRNKIYKDYRSPLGASEQAQNDVKLSNHIAKLFNITYDNIPQTDNKSFTIGKLNYLVGFNLLEKYPEALAYVELANKSTDMKEVKEAASAIKNGEDSKKVFARYDIDMDAINKMEGEEFYAKESKYRKFTDTIKPRSVSESIAEKMNNEIKPKSLTDYAREVTGNSISQPSV